MSRGRGRMLARVTLLATLAAGHAEAEVRSARAASSAEGTIVLDDVLQSADASFPALVAAGLERDVRSAALKATRGAFDTSLRLDGEVRPLGYYENVSGGAGIEQPTTLWGTRLFAGYRYGGGDYPSYEGDRLTDGAGEASAGLVVPLLRGGPIDAPRAKIRRSRVDLERVEPEVALQRLDVRRAAAHAYWDWVATGLGLDIAERLLEVAVDRQSQIEGRVRRGAEAEIDLVDNERLIVDRRLRLRSARGAFEQATATLSLYLRDDDGRPVVARRTSLPPSFPAEVALDADAIAADLARARERHPAIRRLGLDLERLGVDERLARNDALPAVDLTIRGARDFGESEPGIDAFGQVSPAPRSEGELKALVRVEWPIQRREARGRLAVARLKAAQTEERLRLERDRIEVEIQRAVAGLGAAYDRTVAARRNLELAERLRLGEERKLSLGQSNLIDVNIRELQAASAALLVVEAQADYFRARADYDAAAARALPGAEGAADADSGSGPLPESTGRLQPLRIGPDGRG